MPGNVQSVTPSFGDKVFEPVVSLRRDQSEEQAATLASESRFGLGAAIVTATLARLATLQNRELNWIKGNQYFREKESTYSLRWLRREWLHP
ncbi:MAG: hypothetical protein EVB08_03515 [Synechococcus sp. MED-G135]|nr:MAG: hypothetical protein EVB08_03515 [Synechococcus sp. MED-G135]